MGSGKESFRVSVKQRRFVYIACVRWRPTLVDGFDLHLFYVYFDGFLSCVFVKTKNNVFVVGCLVLSRLH